MPIDAARPSYDDAVAWMAGWVRGCGENYPDYGARLRWEAARDATFRTEGDDQAFGHCQTTSGSGMPTTHHIQILYFTRPITFQETLVHELTHAWANENGVGGMLLIEGFCNYVASLFLNHLRAATQDAARQREIDRHIARMNENNNREYGENFRRIRAAINNPADAIRWFRANGDRAI